MSQKIVLKINNKNRNNNKDPPVKRDKVLAEVYGKVVYINRKNRKLFSIHAEKMNKKFRCKLDWSNPFCPLQEGDAIYAIAEYIKDPRYGDTLNIIKAPFVVLGEDKDTILKGFATALRGSGFGTMKANELIEFMVSKTGSLTNSIRALDGLSDQHCYKNINDPGFFSDYTSILREKQLLRLLEWWYKNRNLRRLYLLGLNNKEIREAKKSPNEIYEICLENPYKITSIPVEKCDRIVDQLGKEVDPINRKCAEITRKLNDYMVNRGWTGVPSRFIVNMYPNISQYIDRLRENFDVVAEMHTVYLSYPHQVETGLCDFVSDLLDGPTLPHAIGSSEITYTRDDLSEDQKLVIGKALTDNICIIKGAAGTGKTTVIKEIVHNLSEKGIKYRVVSFTGKAVARIREVIDQKEPMTMHMSITLAGSKKKASSFSHLIIDEASMVTSDLLYEFLTKFGSEYRVTLIGDPNQLTPIGWGSMFEQMIKSGVIPTYTLSMCHRVSSSGSSSSGSEENSVSGILINANNIVECGDPEYNGPAFDFEETPEFKIVDGDMSTIRELVTILQNCGTPNSKITIICPYNKYLQEINKICQEIYNGINRSVRDERGVLWRINDRVMMTENNYKYNIMNGDEGIVTDITPTQVQVTFKDGSNEIFYLSGGSEEENEEGGSKCKELYTGQLIHSFGVSVHRYQGSENDYIIFYVPESKPSKFLNRNLLYTGITRARKLIWMVGHYDTMVAAATTSPPYRCDNLGTRLVNMKTIDLR